jgi:DMSO/TMAO reductase YedYZ molybdopterin-dependent catalytic subunit
MDERRTAGWIGFGAGVVAAALMGVAMLIVRMAAGIPSYPELIGNALSSNVPIALFNLSTGTLGTETKPLLFSIITLGMVTVGGLLGLLYTRRLCRPDQGWQRGMLFPAVRLGGIVWLVLMLVLSPLVGAGMLGASLRGGPTGYLLTGLLLCALYAATLAGMTAALRRAFAPMDDTETVIDERRRALLHNVAIGVGLVSLGGLFVQVRRFAFHPPPDAAPSSPQRVTPARQQAETIAQTARARANQAANSGVAAPQPTTIPPPSAAPSSGTTTGPTATATPASSTAPLNTATPPVPFEPAPSDPAADLMFQLVANKLPPEVTDSDHFYVISKNFSDPVVRQEKWRLTVDGMVERPTTLAYEDLLALPSTTFLRTQECISNEIGGDLISNGQWTGVPLRIVLERAGIKAGAVKVQFTCDDGYTTAIPIAEATEEQTILAYQLNGVPLPERHGFPTRLIFPAHYGMKNPKWITRITVTSDDYLGYWERQGWSDTAIVQTMARIDTPTRKDQLAVGVPTVVAGIAYAGSRGIARVEVSTDDGTSWEQAALQPPLGTLTWVFWAYQWTPPKAGEFKVLVRATDGGGTLQPAESTPPIPLGATGYHRVPMTVR